ncbi:response regulator [Halosquirtibacter xylanolyticus]|uniref:hybrid sensor histidine kinase/response regulator transcription factor n=1 Tax=Halosquirtibacter xylanolyticus TaxID=3374599 RepID=UPI0037494BC1|nr:response regulator [Prolixibacteraceae bacterium]
MIRNVLTIGILILITSFHALCQEDYDFNRITVEDGLLSNKVRVVYKDSYGYMWIGTSEGINKYDGTKIHSYKFGSKRNHNLKGRRILFIFEDDDHTLYIGTNTKLSIYNREKDRFESLKVPQLKKSFFCYQNLQDKIYFGRSNQIVIYDKVHKTARTIEIKIPQFKDVLYKIEAFKDGAIVVVTNKGVWRIANDNSLDLISKHHVVGPIASLVDHLDILWVGNTEEGITCLDSNGDKQNIGVLKENVDPAKVFIQDFGEKDDEVFFTTDGQGIWIYNRLTKKIKKVKHIRGDRNSIPTNSLIDLFIDKHGNILMGTVRFGLISLHKVNIKSYTESPRNSHSGISTSTVIDFYEESPRKVWIGTEGGGLNLFDPLTERFEHIEQYNKEKVVSICSYKEGLILVSFYRNGVHMFDTKSRKFIPDNQFPWLKSISNLSLSTPIILRKDSKGRIWKFGWKVQFITPSQQIVSISEKNGWEGGAPSQVSDLIELNDNEYLLGGMNGLHHIDLDSRKSTYLFNLMENNMSEKSDNRYVYSMIKKDNIIWCATSIGLISYNLETKEIKHISSSFFGYSYCIADCDNDSFWITSERGLYKYTITKDNFRSYGKPEGNPFVSFSGRHSISTENGDTYLGTINGFLRISQNINSKQIISNPSLTIDHIMVNGIPLGRNKECKIENNRLQLPTDNSSLRLNVVVDEKNFFRKRMYKYKIEGFTENEIKTSNPEINITHLPPGEYTLNIYCNREDGEWIQCANQLSIFVPALWWKRWWFILILIIGIVAILALIRHYLIKQSELMIELEVERERKSQVKKLNDEKLEFFTNISHELRTPLSLLYGPLKQISKRGAAPQELDSEIKLMTRQAEKMKTLIDQVLDIRKMDANKEVLVVSEINIQQWMTNFIEQFSYELSSKNIKLILNFNYTPIVFCDTDKLDKILSNLVSNAIKYSPSDSVITISGNKRDEQLVISVIDQGVGIKEKDIEAIFERFFQGEGHKKGTGIGLAFTKKLVELMGGEIKAYNNTTAGAVFELSLPLTPNKYFIETNNKVIKPLNDKKSDVNIHHILKGKNIVVVEDDPDLRNFITKELKCYCNVKDASDGKKAWPLILSEKPDFIISDVMMPNMDGFELVSKVRQDITISHIPILLLTAKNDEQTRIEAYYGGADSYLPKPFGIDILLARMGNILINRQRYRELFQQGEIVNINAISTNNRDKVFLNQVISIINDNMEDSDFDVTKLNNEFAMSRSTFYAKIKSLTDLGVNDFIKSIKINKATELLLQTDLPVGEIAYKVGYTNQRYFSTVFKDIKQCTPSQFRNQKYHTKTK